MKKILFGISILAVLLTSSCSDFLEETAYSKFSKEEANSNPTLVYLNSVASIYSGMSVQGLCWDQNRSGRFHYISECGGDLMIVQGRRSDWVDGGAHQQMHAHTYGPAYAVFNSAWNFNFQQIGLINNNIDYLQERINNGGETFYQEYINELRAVRAYYYLQLINEFGRVPIVTTSEMSVSNVNQSKRSEVYAWLRDELIEILPTLSPLNSVLTTSGEYYGRMTQPVVYMMLAKLAINAAVWSQDTWNDGRFTGGIDKVAPGITAAGKEQKITLDGATRNAWETVIYIQEKLNSLGYQLQPNIMENFLIGNQEVSKENIFVRPNDPVTYRLQLSLVNDSIHSNHTAAIKNLRGSNGPSLTKEGALLFGCKPAPESESISECDYSEVDPRFKEFFYYDRIIENGKQVNISAGYSNILVYKPLAVKLDWGSPLSGSKEEYDMWTAGARVYKIRIDAARDQFYWSYDYTDADMVVYRYSDLLLLSAEAHYRLGETQEALELVNQVRNRVEATPRTSISLKTILDERALELVWEPTRREDLIRYGMYTEPTADRYPGVQAANGVGEWKYDAEGYTTVCPIPTPALQLNANFTQNPGY